MQATPAIARFRWSQAKVVHCMLGATSAPTKVSGYDLSLTDPSSISLALHGSCEAIISKAEKTSTRRVSAGEIALCGPEPIRWLGATGPGVGEFIEITAEPEFRRELAKELGISNHFELDDIHGWNDHILWAVATRFRSAARGTSFVSDLERDQMLRQLYGRVFETRFGGHLPTRGQGALDPIRLNRILEYIEANLDESLTIAKLAEVAALSPFHFVRAFRRSSGLTPHRYTRARRLERARMLLATGLSPRKVAQRIGYEGYSHFKAAYRAHFGVSHENDPCVRRPDREVAKQTRHSKGLFW